MPMQKTLRYILSSLLLVLFANSSLQAQTQSQPAKDTTATDSTTHVKAKELTTHQLSVSFDIMQPVYNLLESYRTGYEVAIDYYLHKQLYVVGEGGFGKGTVSYSNLDYTCNNSFFRVGFNKCLLARQTPKDWDMAYMGLRYGMAFAQRSPASFTTTDSLWGNTSGTVAGRPSFTPYWFELVGGVRVEVAKRFSLGWSIRGKFMINSNSFKDLSPIYIAGYGRGDKTAVFDFNFYATYAIHWRRKHEI